jgi:glycosyltransferase involved in cell wall biosynthesis
MPNKPHPIISIIIPVYNAERHLEHCINSVLTQSFKGFECILIDDGSHDKSPLICDEYVKKDSRINVIHKVNGGASSARNAGLDIAQGEWITFIDSDDWVDENYLLLLYKNALENNCDMSVCGSKSINEKGELLDKNKPSPLMFFNQISAKKALFNYKYIGTGICSKLVKKQIIIDNNIRFDNKIKVCEDGLFWFQVIDKLKKIVYDSTPYYNYLIHEFSITNSLEKFDNYKSHFVATRKMLYIEKNKSVIWEIKSYNAQIARNICVTFIKSNNTQKEIYSFYRFHLFLSIFYLLFDIKKDIKYKIITMFLFFPKLYILLRKFYNIYKKFKFMIINTFIKQYKYA